MGRERYLGELELLSFCLTSALLTTNSTALCVRNAFCRPVEETEAEGMSELYRHLATQGVAGFHYVSNSPYELLPVLQSFLKHHAFPTGFSLKVGLMLWTGQCLCAEVRAG